MAKNWAIVIGINQYSFLQSLNYAKTDAETMYHWLGDGEGGRFDSNGLFLFTDDSKPIATQPPIITQPTFGHLDSFFDVQFDRPLLNSSDNLWFFFSGHGNRGSGGDYLMLSDSNPRRLEKTALPVSYITERLRNWGAGNVVMFIDACRNVEDSSKGGEIANQDYQGIIAFYSCRAKEKSLEVKSIKQGAFTHILLKALEKTKKDNGCLTVTKLEKYLMEEVPKLSPNQHPLAKVEPTYKSNFILFGEAQPDNIESLKNLAINMAFIEDKKEEARELLIHANMVAKGGNLDIINALAKLSNDSLVTPKIPLPTPNPPTPVEPQPIPIPSPTAEIELKSAKGVDYTKLRNLLAAGKWKEADKETAEVMCQAANRVTEGWLRVEDIDNFPCEDLRTIDQLWVHYSKGKFGFSVQKKIYMDELGGTRDYNEKIWYEFCDRVGWRKGGDYVSYDDLTFELLNTTPVGLLPIKGCDGYVDLLPVSVRGLITRRPLETSPPFLFSHAKTCKL